MALRGRFVSIVAAVLVMIFGGLWNNGHDGAFDYTYRSYASLFSSMEDRSAVSSSAKLLFANQTSGMDINDTQTTPDSKKPEQRFQLSNNAMQANATLRLTLTSIQKDTTINISARNSTEKKDFKNEASKKSVNNTAAPNATQPGSSTRKKHMFKNGTSQVIVGNRTVSRVSTPAGESSTQKQQDFNNETSQKTVKRLGIHNVTTVAEQRLTENIVVFRNETAKKGTNNMTVSGAGAKTGRSHANSMGNVSDISNNQVVAFEIVKKGAVQYAQDWDHCDKGTFTNKFGRHGQHRKGLFGGLLNLTNFSTTLSLSTLRILVLGDSVGMQIFHILDVASGGVVKNRTVLESAFGDHISYGVSSTGNLGAMRMTGMLLRKGENKPLPNAEGGGWNKTMVRALLDIPGANGKQARSFDVMLFRIPHGWLELNEITLSTIKETLELASDMMGVKKVILLTLPFNNNVDAKSRQNWLKKNRKIHEFANRFESNKTVPGIEKLVVMDFAQLTNEFIQANAKHLGYLNDTDSVEMEYLDVRLKDYMPKVRPAAAHVCAGPLFKKQTRLLCDKNAITPDGMHFCSNTFGGRIVAGTGCLLQCLHDRSGSDLLGCQKKCNDSFMRLKAVQIGTRQV